MIVLLLFLQKQNLPLARESIMPSLWYFPPQKFKKKQHTCCLVVQKQTNSTTTVSISGHLVVHPAASQSQDPFIFIFVAPTHCTSENLNRVLLGLIDPIHDP